MATKKYTAPDKYELGADLGNIKKKTQDPGLFGHKLTTSGAQPAEGASWTAMTKGGLGNWKTSQADRNPLWATWYDPGYGDNKEFFGAHDYLQAHKRLTTSPLYRDKAGKQLFSSSDALKIIQHYLKSGHVQTGTTQHGNKFSEGTAKIGEGLKKDLELTDTYKGKGASQSGYYSSIYGTKGKYDLDDYRAWKSWGRTDKQIWDQVFGGKAGYRSGSEWAKLDKTAQKETFNVDLLADADKPGKAGGLWERLKLGWQAQWNPQGMSKYIDAEGLAQSRSQADISGTATTTKPTTTTTATTTKPTTTTTTTSTTPTIGTSSQNKAITQGAVTTQLKASVSGIPTGYKFGTEWQKGLTGGKIGTQASLTKESALGLQKDTKTDKYVDPVESYVKQLLVPTNVDSGGDLRLGYTDRLPASSRPASRVRRFTGTKDLTREARKKLTIT